MAATRSGSSGPSAATTSARVGRLHQLGDDEGRVVLGQHVDHRHRAGIAEPGHRLGVGHQAGRQGRPLLLAEDRGEADLLDRDLPFDQKILRPPHHAHAAGAELGQQFVAKVDDIAGLFLWSHGPNATRR